MTWRRGRRSRTPRAPDVIVDAHLHVDEIPALGWQLDAAECIRRMDEAGIERGIIMTIVDAPEVNPDALDLIASACARYPGRLDAFAKTLGLGGNHLHLVAAPADHFRDAIRDVARLPVERTVQNDEFHADTHALSKEAMKESRRAASRQSMPAAVARPPPLNARQNSTAEGPLVAERTLTM